VPVSTARPHSLIVAAALTGVAAALMAVMGVLSVLARFAALSVGIGAVLVAWALVLAWAAWGLFRGKRWARGPVVAGGLLHLASFANFMPSQPLAAIGAVVAAATVATAVWPSTTKALKLDERDA